jgi:SOS response regulatory protein OraA/RecX
LAIKPLKISWRDWCLYKLGTRDDSAYEMRQAIEKRAAAGETVDAGPIVEGLVAVGAIDDERYVHNQLSLHSGTFAAKGPRELRRLLRTRGGIDEALIASAIDDSDHRWFKAAESQCRKILGQDAPMDGSRRPLPEKQYFGVKQKLYGRGFTAEQIEHVQAGYTPQREAPSVDPAVDVAKWVERRMADGKGPAIIERFLAQKGVEKTVISQHAYTIGALILPENDLEAYRFTDDPDHPSLAPPAGTPVYSVTSVITRTKTDSTQGGEAITGIEYYAESDGGDPALITASTLSYTLEAARSGDPTTIRTVTRSEKELVKDAGGLWQTALSKSIGLSASGNPNNNWNVTIVKVVMNPKADRPADNPFYESVESIWRGTAAANIELATRYPTSNHQFVIALNPSVGGGFSGQLYDRRSVGGAYQVSDVTVIGGVVSLTRAGSTSDYPGVYSRGWREEIVGPSVVFSSQGEAETVEINVAALDNIQIKVPSGTGTFTGKYGSHEFIGTYALDGASTEVLITTHGVYLHYGTTNEQFVPWE